jgi:hypothetical protein
MGRKKKKEAAWEPPPEIDDEAEAAALAALLDLCSDGEAEAEQAAAGEPKAEPKQREVRCYVLHLLSRTWCFMTRAGDGPGWREEQGAAEEGKEGN